MTNLLFLFLKFSIVKAKINFYTEEESLWYDLYYKLVHLNSNLKPKIYSTSFSTMKLLLFLKISINIELKKKKENIKISF